MFNPQTKVGLLIISAVIITLVIIVNLGDIEIRRGYEFYVMFDDLADLPSRPVVKISGVEVGRVNKVELYKGKARIKVWVDDKIKIYKDAKVKILKMGMIGNTYVSLTRGTSEYPAIKKGETIDGVNPLSYEEVIDSFVTGLNEVVKVFQKIGGNKDIGTNISETFANLKELSSGLNSALGKDGEKLGKAMDNINDVILNVSEMFENLDTTLDKEGKSISESIQKLGEAADALKVILQDISQGKSTAGKILASDEYGKKIGDTIDSIYSASVDLKEAVNRFKGFDTLWDAGVYYEPESEMFRSYSGLTFRTSSDRFLNITMENIVPPDSTGRFDSEGDRINALTIKAGKKFGDFVVFGGAIRSSGGIGLNWLYKSKLKLQTEMFEFSRKNPWWNLSSRLKLVKFLSVGVAYEDILDRSSFRTGLALELE